MSREEIFKQHDLDSKHDLARAIKVGAWLCAAIGVGMGVLAVSGSPELTASSLIVGGTVAAAAGVVTTREK